VATLTIAGAFVAALDLSVADHVGMLEVVQPYVDTAISKTVNIPADYPFEEFADLYLVAWKAGLKGLSTYRPNSVLGAVLSVPAAPEAQADESKDEVDPDRRMVIRDIPNLFSEACAGLDAPRSREGTRRGPT